MKKIFLSEQIKALDAETINSKPIPSIYLMEQAALAFVRWFEQHYMPAQTIIICCGPGNNGGDGLAIARRLYQKKYPVLVVVISNSNFYSTDFSINLKRLPRGIPVSFYSESKSIDPDLLSKSIVIDAIFGTGLKRPFTGIFQEIVQQVNRDAKHVIAVDIPSGLSCDNQNFNHPIIKANYSVSFQYPKLSFFYPENEAYVGQWVCVNIGIDAQLIQKEATPYYYLNHSFIKGILNTRSKFAHKGNFGRCYVIGGSYGKIGAVMLAAKSCLRTGAGLVSVLAPRCGYEVIQTALPEAMVLTGDDHHKLQDATILDIKNDEVLGIGPGMGTHASTKSFLQNCLEKLNRPAVFDADAINILARHQELLELIPPFSILTPHLKEFERLVGHCSNHWERIQKLRSIAQQLNIIVVLKGAHTAIADTAGHVYFNTTGNPGMATAGSGDVLTGILTSLLGQGYTPLQVAQIGVFIHGLAGDMASCETGQEGLIASDIVQKIGSAFNQIRNSEIA